MAVNIYLSIPGLTDEKGAPQPGTVLIDSTPYLQISDFSFSIANTGVASMGAAAGKVELEFNPLTVVLPVDFVTPLLLQACAEGTQFANASLIVQAGGASPPVTTQKYDFKSVVLRSLSLAGSTSGDQQSLTFGYGALQITYTPLNAQGKAQTPSTGGFDITTNKAT